MHYYGLGTSRTMLFSFLKLLRSGNVVVTPFHLQAHRLSVHVLKLLVILLLKHLY